MKLENKNALVTGSSQGLGLEIAKSFVKQGANVVLCARGEETLKQAQQEVTQLAGESIRVLARPADVSAQ